MKIAPFRTEHFYAKYEFTTPHQLCNSDCDTVTVEELLDMADMSLEQFGKLSLGYTESLGNPLLRELIAGMYDKPTVDDVIELGTPIEGIYLAARAILDPGDEVIVLTPAYDALTNVFEHVAGADKVKRWEITPTDAGWMLDIDVLEGLISAETKLLVVNFPHNPTGLVPTHAEMQRLADLAEQHNFYIFYDEMYFGLINAGTPTIPSMVDVSPRSIVLSGLSKTYGMPGLRSGWLVIQDEELRENIVNWKFYTSICPPAPSEFMAIAALRVWEQLRDKNIAQVAENMALAEAFFARWPELFTFRRPLGGSMALVEMHVPSVEAFAFKMAEEAGVLIQPATTLGAADRYFRMGFGRKKFPEALTHFETYLQQNREALAA